MKITVFYNEDKKDAVLYAQKIKNILDTFKVETLLCCDKEYYDSAKDATRNCDVILVVGGDGTIVKYSKLACEFYKPILGINSGRLGFLAGLEKDEVRKLKNIVYGEYKIVKRMLIRANINDFNKSVLALNDIVISRGSSSQIIDFRVMRYGRTICSFRADGIIIATPTGSTAYSLSAGGPIVEAGMRCFIMTPICPHSLSVRPFILDPSEEVQVEFSARLGSEIYLMSDGELICHPINSGGIKVSCADRVVNMIAMDDSDFYKNIDKKLIGKDLH